MQSVVENDGTNQTEGPARQLEVKTRLNRIQQFVGFVYQAVRLCAPRGKLRIEVKIEPHQSLRGRCSACHRPAPGYDRLPERWWLFVPLWGIVTWFRYAPRRVECAEHGGGGGGEHIPWNEGKRPSTRAMMGFLARWARHLSWRQTARSFQTGWECVYRSVEWCVQWGLAHRKLEGVEAIGVDAIHWGKSQGANVFLTLIYQIDRHGVRLLWVGPKRTQATLRRGLAALGPEVVGGLRFVCSDMWRPYLNGIAAQVGQALHVLDRFHITRPLNHAGDQVRRAERARLRGRPLAARLKKRRWKLLRKGSRVRGRAKDKLHGLLRAKLATGRAWRRKETFRDFWRYRSLTWASAFLDVWCPRALRRRLDPMQKVARMLRAHEERILNWFRAKGQISSGAGEGLNNKIRVVTRRSYGFRTFAAMEIALYHTLARLPEPDECTHRFC
jgi:transposase